MRRASVPSGKVTAADGMYRFCGVGVITPFASEYARLLVKLVADQVFARLNTSKFRSSL